MLISKFIWQYLSGHTFPVIPKGSGNIQVYILSVFYRLIHIYSMHSQWSWNVSTEKCDLFVVIMAALKYFDDEEREYSQECEHALDDTTILRI